MIQTKDLRKILNKNKINFFTGVPDSVLKSLSDHFQSYSKKKHIIAVNEGSAVSIGIGYHLSSKKIPCIYLQNSGLGNAINPLVSVAHNKVYSIPMLLLIGWRGSMNNKDEPQHITQGKITPDLLKLLNINYCILKRKDDLKKLEKLIQFSKKNFVPVACLIEKGTFERNLKKKKSSKKSTLLKRKDFILELLRQVPKSSKIISTTGYTSRELHKIRKEKKLFKGRDFYMVGGMGHSSMVSLGASLHTKKEIICIDGDGSLLMHLGSIRTIGFAKSPNIKHILLNNNSHESVGGQKTYAQGINFKKLTESIGYRHYFKLIKRNKFKSTISKFLNSKGPSFLEVLISKGSFDNLGRPKNLKKIKKFFMN